ncbi:unnamed protein product [Cylindrotheca closterium]|uniref:Subtilisin n=1 Tax=Cylindrotheca closterium TaxID=2856 RepID=A0AAD2G3S4_9STRA|nr:unnamed protein product [Cylindrotheca closterium]
MMKAILLFAMISTVMGLRRAPQMPKQAHVNTMAWAGVDDIDADMEYELLDTKYKEGVIPVKRVLVKPAKKQEEHLEWAGVDDVDADMEYELLDTKYREGVAPVKRVVKPNKKLEEKHLKCVPAKGVLFGISHVDELDQICFLE